MRCWRIGTKVHFSIIEQEMLRYAASEVSFFVRANANNSWAGPAMGPSFALFVKEIDSIIW
jgi:hypothetical protein